MSDRYPNLLLATTLGAGLVLFPYTTVRAAQIVGGGTSANLSPRMRHIRATPLQTLVSVAHRAGELCAQAAQQVVVTWKQVRYRAIENVALLATEKKPAGEDAVMAAGLPKARLYLQLAKIAQFGVHNDDSAQRGSARCADTMTPPSRHYAV